MIRRYIPAVILLGFVLAVMPDISKAQNLRPEDTFYIKPRVGIAWHLGDTEKSPFTFNMDNWKVDGKIPFAGGLELGYQFNQTTSLSLGWQITNHPLVFHYGDEVPTTGNVEDDGTTYNVAQLLLRFQAPSRVAPFLAVGGHVGFGQDGRIDDPYFGPSVGLGLDIVLSDRISLVLENIANLTFSDEGFDGMEENQFGDSFAPFDVQNALTLGLKINFKSALVPVDVLAIDCPQTVDAGQSATFTATVNEDATTPVEYRWDFGDGNTATGLLATHTFANPGTYTVQFTASNRGSTDTETCTVNVVPPPVPAEVVSISANPQTFEVCEPVTVTFNANVTGDTPITYSWDFGDGTTGTGPNPTHTYTTAGNYTVSLTVSNEAGSDTETITINAQDCTSVCDDITELNSVYFGRNSSTLTPEGSQALMENIEILRECPNICVRIEGFAAPGERNPQQLSEDRARAVEQFYIDNGISGSRLMAIGMGRVTGVTSKKEGTSQYQRVDSIPMACDMMGSK